MENEHPSIDIKARFRFHFHKKKKGVGGVVAGLLIGAIQDALQALFRPNFRRHSGIISGAVQARFGGVTATSFKRHLHFVR